MNKALKEIQLDIDKKILKDLKYSFSEDSDTGFFNPSSDQLEIVTSNNTGQPNANSIYTPTTTTGTINIGGTGGGSSGNISITPYTPNYNPVTVTSTGFGVNNPKQKYTVFKLPKKGIVPNKVYVAGRLVTVGILGSDVQAAFAGDKLVFAPGEINVITYNEKLTISLDYGDWVYHYNVELDAFGQVSYEEDSNIVKAKMVSKVAQR